MLKKFWILFLWIGLSQPIFFTLQSFGEGRHFAQTDIESKKIEFLLHEVEQLKGAKFWRNGTSYSPKQAADHLRMKWQKADRKSTRLNSSHQIISYAVFCLKKKILNLHLIRTYHHTWLLELS